MTRRIRPPMHPVTGNPPVDNELRNSWRDCRDTLRAQPGVIFFWYVLNGSVPAKVPRKAKKRIRMNTQLTKYHPAPYCTPERNVLYV